MEKRRKFELNLKKQSQFANETYRLKVLYGRELWQYTALQGTKKQSQSNPISRLCYCRPMALMIASLAFSVAGL